MEKGFFEVSKFKRHAYGVVSTKSLKKSKTHKFLLWDQEYILFWNNGQPTCFRNFCPHFGMPLDQGTLKDSQLKCAFHGWTFDIRNGSLLEAPLNVEKPLCRLNQAHAFIHGGVVFVFLGDKSALLSVKQFLLDDTFQPQESFWVDFPVPFFLALNSVLDYGHHRSHTLFYQLYGVYRFLMTGKRENPMGATFTPIMIDESENHFRYRVAETNVEIECRPFGAEYLDPVGQYRWQFYVLPYSQEKTRYLMNLSVFSKNPFQRLAIRLVFHFFVKRILVPEDKAWLEGISKNWKNALMLSHQDFGLKNYFRKFFQQKERERESLHHA